MREWDYAWSVLRVRLLGGLALELDGEPLDPPTSRRARSLLAWLALNPGSHPRSQVAARFWPEVLNSGARASLRTTLHELRRALGDAASHLITTREQVSLDGGTDLWVDTRALEDLAAADRFETSVRASVVATAGRSGGRQRALRWLVRDAV